MATQPPRETLRVKPKPRVTLEEMVKLDVENLMELPSFRRYMLTVLKTAGIYTGSFHSEAAYLAYAEGRRSLGLDMLRTLTEVSEDAHIRILSEASTLEEAINVRRNHDRTRDLDDAGSPDDGDRSRADPDSGPGFIRYGQSDGAD